MSSGFSNCVEVNFSLTVGGPGNIEAKRGVDGFSSKFKHSARLNSCSGVPTGFSKDQIFPLVSRCKSFMLILEGPGDMKRILRIVVKLGEGLEKGQKKEEEKKCVYFVN